MPSTPDAFTRASAGAGAGVVAAAAILALAACGPSPLPAPPRSHAAEKVDPSKSHAAAVLANVENARFVLSRGDRTAADNDLLRAIDAAKHIPDETQDIFIDNPLHRAPDRLSPFAVRVQLISARTAVVTGRLADADRALSTILAGVPASVVPRSLPLVSARESLALAAVAAKTGEKGQLGAQLEDAKAALELYAARTHSKADQALAKEIGAYADHPERLAALSVEQPLLWAGRIQQ